MCLKTLKSDACAEHPNPIYLLVVLLSCQCKNVHQQEAVAECPAACSQLLFQSSRGFHIHSYIHGTAMWGEYHQDCVVHIPYYCCKNWMSIPISCLEAQHRLTLRLWTVIKCPHLVTCDGMHQNLIILSKADVWNLFLSCCSDVYCNIIGNSLSGSQGVCRQPHTGHHKDRHNIPSAAAV